MLESLELENFKSFRHAKADFGKLSLIVGTNASGKSNLREALRLLHGIGLGYPIAEILGEKYGQGGILQWRGVRGGAKEAAFEGGGSFAIAAKLRAPDESSHRGQLFTYRIEVDVANFQTGPRVVAESLRYASGFVFDSDPPDDPLEQKGEHQLRARYPRGGAKSRGKVVELSSARPLLSQLAERAREPAATRATCRAVLDVLGSMRFLDLEPAAMRIPSQPGQVVLGDRGENLSSVLSSICEDAGRRKTLLEWLRALTPMDARDFAFHADFTGRILVHLVEGEGFEVSALSASDGTLRFLALVAALLSEDTGRIFFFEEFDNGIHPTRLHLLLDLVQRVCRDNEVQVIGTTHNPALLAFLDEKARDHALLVYRSEYAVGSRLVPLMSLPDVRTIIKTQDLGRLHQAGWLEDAAVFSQDDDGDAGSTDGL